MTSNQYGVLLIFIGMLFFSVQDVLIKKIVSQVKLNVPTYKKSNLPKSLKELPISAPGSRYL